MPQLRIELKQDVIDDLQEIARGETITASQFVADLIELEVDYERKARSVFNPLPSQKKKGDNAKTDH